MDLFSQEFGCDTLEFLDEQLKDAMKGHVGHQVPKVEAKEADTSLEVVEDSPNRDRTVFQKSMRTKIREKSLKMKKQEVEGLAEIFAKDLSFEDEKLFENTDEAEAFFDMDSVCFTAEEVPKHDLDDSVIPEGSLRWIESPNIQTETVFKIPESPAAKDLKVLSNWGLPQCILTEYKRKGIEEMFDWQKECLSNTKVLFDRANLVYCAPTSAGKTLVSEILLAKTCLERNKKALMILPFVSVVREKMFYLKDLLSPAGIRVEGFFGGYNPPGGFENVHVAICTIEKANSIINRLLEGGKLAEVGAIVVDEIHLLADPSRGYILELLLAKILYMKRLKGLNIQIVAMSATLPNLHLLTEWLDAEFFWTDYRPVELQEMVKIGGNLFDAQLKPLRGIQGEEIYGKDPDNVAQLCLEPILAGFSTLIFVASKDWCEQLCLTLAHIIHNMKKLATPEAENLRESLRYDKEIDELKLQLKNCPIGLDVNLEKMLTYGCAYHHAGLTAEERDIIENGFKSGWLKILVATSTLSSGVNLPARRVIIRSPMFAGKVMDALTYKQMIGRAGRKGKDTLGESILICAEAQRKAGESLVCAQLQPLSSCLDSNSHGHLKRAILEIIASNVVQTRSELEQFINCTLLCAEKGTKFEYFNPDVQEPSEDDPIATSISFLLEFEFIRLQHNTERDEEIYVATKLGMACLSSSMAPNDGFHLFSELQKARQSFVLESDLHAIYLVTPYTVCYQLGDIDWLFFIDIWERLSPSAKRVGQLVGVTDSFLIKAMRSRTTLDQKSLQIHKRFYIALALQELVNEVPLNHVAQKFKCTRGMLQSLQQMASTFAGIVTSFCTALKWDLLALIVSQFRERLFFGIHRDLLDLMKIPNLNAQRARALFNNGITTLQELATSETFIIEKILFDCVSFDSEKKRDGEAEFEANQRKHLRNLYITGKSGLTVSEAAKLLIHDARHYLEIELGVDNVEWSRKVERENIEKGEVVPPTPEIAPPTLETPAKVPNKRKSDELSPLQEYVASSQEDTMTRTRGKSQKPSFDISSGSEQSLFHDSLVMNLPEIVSQFNVIDVCKTRRLFTAFEHDLLSTNDAVTVSVALELVETANIFTIGGKLLADHQKTLAGTTAKRYGNGTYHIAGVAFVFETQTNNPFFMTLQDDGNDPMITNCTKIDLLKKFFTREGAAVVIYDAKEQLKVLKRQITEFPLSVKAHVEDPKIAFWLVAPEESNTLSKMVVKYGGKNETELLKVVGGGNYNSLGLNYNLEDGRHRSCVEGCVASQVMKSLRIELSKGKGYLQKSFIGLEMPIQLCLYKMEVHGVGVSRFDLEDLIELCKTLKKQLKREIFTLHGSEFNLDSAAEVGKILGLHANGKKKPSTAKSVLSKLERPIADLIMEYRKLESAIAKSMYPIFNILEGDKIYGRSFSFTQTGRISMSEPNLQSVPRDFTIQKKLISCRSVFKPRAGHSFLVADFCQLELRVLTHFSQDPSLLEIMKSSEDVFKVIASKWYRVTKVTDKQRNDAKQICYGIIYGMGNKAIAEALSTDEDAAQLLTDQFHATYPGIRQYTETIIKNARHQGYVQTITGRRRYLPNITSINTRESHAAERQAINTIIQGSAADISKSAILRMDKNITRHSKVLGLSVSNTADLVLHIHDELIYEIPTTALKGLGRLLKNAMENCIKLSIPLRVKLKTGRSWGELNDLVV